MTKRFKIIGVLLVLFCLDQGTKYWAIHSLSSFRPISIFPGLSFVLVGNKGVSFGLFDGWGQGVLIGVTGILALGFFIAFLRTQEIMYQWIYGLVVVGACGNLLDRLRFGVVIDFVDIYWKEYHWPTFNVADILITCAAMLMVLDTLRKWSKSRTTSKE